MSDLDAPDKESKERGWRASRGAEHRADGLGLREGFLRVRCIVPHAVVTRTVVARDGTRPLDVLLEVLHQRLAGACGPRPQRRVQLILGERHIVLQEFEQEAARARAVAVVRIAVGLLSDIKLNNHIENDFDSRQA